MSAKRPLLWTATNALLALPPSIVSDLGCTGAVVVVAGAAEVARVRERVPGELGICTDSTVHLYDGQDNRATCVDLDLLEWWHWILGQEALMDAALVARATTLYLDSEFKPGPHQMRDGNSADQRHGWKSGLLQILRTRRRAREWSALATTRGMRIGNTTMGRILAPRRANRWWWQAAYRAAGGGDLADGDSMYGVGLDDLSPELRRLPGVTVTPFWMAESGDYERLRGLAMRGPVFVFAKRAALLSQPSVVREVRAALR